jgi:multidrug transporter EmrE-like cation transporter
VFGLLSNVGFLAGLAVFILANVLWLLVLGSQKLSVAYPVQIGLVVLFNAVISAWFFAESMSVQGYAGLAFIVLGVFLIVR